MASYLESSSNNVSSPLSYSSIQTNALTALLGVGGSYRLNENIFLYLSAGIESDTNNAHGTLNASGVNDLSPVPISSNPEQNRPTASFSAYYDIEKNHRIGFTGIYRQEPFQSITSRSLTATYTASF
jgi:hypothetical protein